MTGIPPTPPVPPSGSQPPPPPARKPPAKNGFPWGQLFGLAVTTFGVYKLVQALTDTEYPRHRTLPTSEKDLLKLRHCLKHGEFCLTCGLAADFGDLVVDHIHPYSKGGRTSVANSQVMCRSCNASKGGRLGVGEWVRGRGGRWS